MKGRSPGNYLPVGGVMSQNDRSTYERRTVTIKRGRLLYIVDRKIEVMCKGISEGMGLEAGRSLRISRRGARRVARRWLRSSPPPRVIETMEAEVA